jgi:NADPH2:quinone reductase
MVTVVQVERFGGPEVLQLVDVALTSPGPGEVQVRQTAVGVNFVDIYCRSGLYPMPTFPASLGVEAAGTIEAVGEGVIGLVPGDRVGYGGLPVGSYAEARNLPATRLLKLPEMIPSRLAAAALLRGLTAHMLVHRVFPLQAGQTVLIHAAAGGMGSILTQWAKRLGVVTIGTVGSEEKAKVAQANGLDHAILYRQTDFVAAVRDLTLGQGVDYAVDGIGGETLAKTFSAVRPFGVVASIGQVGGPIPLVDVHTLRSISLARPSVLAYVSDLNTYRDGASSLFDALADWLTVEIGAEFPLKEAAKAHHALEEGKTTGSVLLTP